jgi:hypothetical protein
VPFIACHFCCQTGNYFPFQDFQARQFLARTLLLAIASLNL